MNSKSNINKESKFNLGGKKLIAFLAFLASFTPLSTDLYLPALPAMREIFGVSSSLVNLTISLFMLFFALSMPIWGPLSDWKGRKPILFIGSTLYLSASIGCAWTDDIYFFIICRCIQAVGGGALGTVSMAIVKDVFKGKIMENMLTTIQVVTIIAPITAPLIGGIILKFMTWRYIFVMLACCGITAMIGTCLLNETNKYSDSSSNLLKSMVKLVNVLSNEKFRKLLFIFSLPTACFMSYLTLSSYIYISIFNKTPQAYSFYFSFIASASVLGPLFYIRFLREIPKRIFFTCVFTIISLCGFVLMIFGGIGVNFFTSVCIAMAFSSSIIRPPATMILMNCQDRDAGTLSSLIGSTGLLCGSGGMLACSFPFTDAVFALGLLFFLPAFFALCAWMYTSRIQNI